VKVAFFRGAALRPVPPGPSTHKDVPSKIVIGHFWMNPFVASLKRTGYRLHRRSSVRCLKVFEPEGTQIEEMFSQLLSRSMDSERAGEAHPAFPIIIRQLSSDEARIQSSFQVERLKQTHYHETN
jgi:hypothetical protein